MTCPAVNGEVIILWLVHVMTYASLHWFLMTMFYKPLRVEVLTTLDSTPSEEDLEGTAWHSLKLMCLGAEIVQVLSAMGTADTQWSTAGSLLGPLWAEEFVDLGPSTIEGKCTKASFTCGLPWRVGLTLRSLRSLLIRRLALAVHSRRTSVLSVMTGQSRPNWCLVDTLRCVTFVQTA